MIKVLVTVKVHLNRIRLNQGGYDRFGHYWGIGSPLFQYNYYVFIGPGDEIEDAEHIRANNREHAKTIIENKLKLKGRKAKFFR